MDSNECTTKSKQSNNNLKSKSSKTRRTTRKNSANSRPAQLSRQTHSGSLKPSKNASDKGSNRFKRNLSQLKRSSINQFVQKISTSTTHIAQLHDKLDKQVSTTQKLEVFMDKHKLKKSQQQANTASQHSLASTTKRCKNFCPVR